jgi:hypothetical protein
MWSHHSKVGIGVEISTSSKAKYRIPHKLDVDGWLTRDLSYRKQAEK